MEISLYSALITVCLFVFRALFKKRISPKLQYGLWMLLVLRLLLPVTIESGFRVADLLPMEFHGASTIKDGSAAFLPKEEAVPAATVLTNPILTKHPSVNKGNLPAVSEALPKPMPARVTNWRFIAFGLWLAGMLLFRLWMLRVKLRFYRDMRQHMVSVSPHVSAVYKACCEALKVKTLCLWVVDRTISPGIAFFSKPILLLPASMAYDTENLRYAFLHELMHKKRYDHIVSMLLSILQSIYWFNPAVHIAFDRMRADMESACDKDVIAFVGNEGKRRYLCAILELFSYNSHPQLGMSRASSRRMAKRRIKGAFMRPNSSLLGRTAAWIFVFVMLLGCFTTACQSPKAQGETVIIELPESMATADVENSAQKQSASVHFEPVPGSSIDLDGDGLSDRVILEAYIPSDPGIPPEEAKAVLSLELGQGNRIVHEIPGWWWPSNCCTADFDADGRTDIALMLGVGGSNYDATRIFVYRLEDGKLSVFPEDLIPNAAITYELSMLQMQNDTVTLEDVCWVSGGTVIIAGQKSMLRLRNLFAYDPGAGITNAYYTNLSWNGDGWLIESMEIGEAYGEEQVYPGTLQPADLDAKQASLQNAAEVFLRTYFDTMCVKNGFLDYALNKKEVKNGQILLSNENRNDMMLLRQWIDYKTMLAEFGYNIEKDCGRFVSLEVHGIEKNENEFSDMDYVLKGYFKTTAFGTLVELGMTDTGNGIFAITSVSFPDWKEYKHFCADFISYMETNGHTDYGKSIYIDVKRRERSAG